MRAKELMATYDAGRRSFHYVIIDDAHLANADLRGASFYGASLRRVNLEHANLTHLQFEDANLT
jgi:uncharacterized protein YjbI with pentapeptide repeats